MLYLWFEYMEFIESFRQTGESTIFFYDFFRIWIVMKMIY